MLTIAGERLELSRAVRVPAAARALFLAAVGVLLASLPLGLADPGAGVRTAGAAFLGPGLWLGRHDVARQAGLTRFIAVCLFSGYVWLRSPGPAARAAAAIRSP